MAGRFSERIGQTDVRTALQVESMDMPLRNRLWSVVYVLLESEGTQMGFSRHAEFYRDIYLNFFHEPLDRVPHWTQHANEKLRAYFYEEEWWKPYDLLEFVLSRYPNHLGAADRFQMANTNLEKYLSGYRFVDEKLVPITDDTHIQTIEKALETKLTGVRTHLGKSLALLADRDRPDPENAIKEAISAVESLCGAIVGKKTTLGDALKRLEDSGVTLHRALKESWLKLYGYTSDAEGIRDSSQLESGATIDDAVYFLVSSSAFIGLLTAKATGAGLDLQPVT